MVKQPTYWMEWALFSESAELEAEGIRAKRNKKGGY